MPPLEEVLLACHMAWQTNGGFFTHTDVHKVLRGGKKQNYNAKLNELKNASPPKIRVHHKIGNTQYFEVC